MKARSIALLFLLLAFLPACGGGHVAGVVVSLSHPGLGVHGTRILLATAKDASGHVIANEPVDFNWEIISGQSCISLDETGFVTGVEEGDAMVRATEKSSGMQGELRLTVAGTVIASTIKLEPNPAQVRIGSTLELEVNAEDSYNYPVVMSPASCIWDITEGQSHASVDGYGRVTGLTIGRSTVQLTDNISGVQAQDYVAVSPPGTIAFVSPRDGSTRDLPVVPRRL